MGQKVHPIAFRIGILKSWSSRWFARTHQGLLAEDVLLREWLRVRLRRSMVTAIDIERSSSIVKVIIATSRPGMLIGRGGAGIEELRRAIIKKLSNIRGRVVNPSEIKVEVQEVRNPDGQAALIGQSVAEQLEKRLPFRRVLKRAVERAMGAGGGVQGAKIAIAGRLGGSEMSRREWLADGKIPLHTLRADIDFAQETAYTTWGTIGVKVWLYKGEVFKEKQDLESNVR